MTINIMQSQTSGPNPMLANAPHSSNSDKYQFISSQAIAKYMESQGFQLDGVSYGRPRNEANRGFQKHVMCWSNPDMTIDGNNKAQILITNSHNRGSSVQLNLGVFRAICANGLISGNSTHEERITHIGDDFKKRLRDSLQYIATQYFSMSNEIQAMRNRQLNYSEFRDFVVDAADYRLRDTEEPVIDYKTAATLHREADSYRDLYTVFNRIQENVIRGGIEYTTTSTNENGEQSTRRNTTREIKSIDRLRETNQWLWNRASELIA